MSLQKSANLTNSSFPTSARGVHEAELIKWRVSVGDHVNEHDILAEMETDKALVESPRLARASSATLNGKGEILKVGNILVTYQASDASAAKSQAAHGAAAEREWGIRSSESPRAQRPPLTPTRDRRRRTHRRCRHRCRKDGRRTRRHVRGHRQGGSPARRPTSGAGPGCRYRQHQRHRHRRPRHREGRPFRIRHSLQRPGAGMGKLPIGSPGLGSRPPSFRSRPLAPGREEVPSSSRLQPSAPARQPVSSPLRRAISASRSAASDAPSPTPASVDQPGRSLHCDGRGRCDRARVAPQETGRRQRERCRSPVLASPSHGCSTRISSAL